MKDKDGGPAFPKQQYRDPQTGELYFDSHGMSLRDWFAGMVIQGIVSNAPYLSVLGSNAELNTSEKLTGVAAKHAYAISDAMLAERNKKNE